VSIDESFDALRGFASEEAPTATSPEATPIVPAASPRDWRTVSLVVVTLVALGQAGFIAFWMLSGSAIAAPPDTGSVIVTSEPAGAAVIIDGAPSGVTPLSVTLATGSHQIEVGEGLQRRGQALSIVRDGIASLYFALAPVAGDASATGGGLPVATEPAGAAPSTAMASGWLTVTSTVPLQIMSRGALVGTSDVPRLVLPAGSHDLELVNTVLDYRTTHRVEVSAGETTSFTPTLPNGTLSINALPWAEVWINGRLVGETPIGNHSIVIGTHEVVFRHPDLGEKRQTVTVGALAPARLGIDLRKQ
jgi:hypothetical protein